MGSFSRTAGQKAAPHLAKGKKQTNVTKEKILHHGWVPAQSCSPSRCFGDNTMFGERRLIFSIASPSVPLCLLHGDDGAEPVPRAGQVLGQGSRGEEDGDGDAGREADGQPASGSSHLPWCRHLRRLHRPGFPDGAKIRVPRCRQPGHRLRRWRQGFHRPDRHHHRLPVDLVSHPPSELNGCKQVWYQRALLVRRGATIQIIIFSILSIMLKTRAPGAKTFLQVIKARFGARTHLVFCTFAFFTNLIVMMSLTVAGTAVLNSLVADLSPELAAMLLAVVIGGYTLIGGLGATFYVSYFNTALIFFLIILLMVEVFFNPFEHVANPFGSSKSIFEFVACWKAPDTSIGNHGGSYLTFFSSGGLVFGIVNLVGNFGTVFCDQAYWQSSVAAKPLQGVWGFIAGGLCWFAIPFGLATTMGLAYLGLSSAQGAPLLSDEDVMKGLAAPLVAQKLLGPVGEYSMLFLILMAVMSTGSAEIIAVASIVIYDVYQTYICPFRRDHKDGQCILCGRYLRQQKGEDVTDVCSCPSAEGCEACNEDTVARAQTLNVVKPHYTCQAHGAYKEYQEHLLNYKNWCIVLCTFLSIPLCLFCWAVDLNLAWTYYFTGILISSSVIPIAMSILWARATSYSLVSGVVGGCLSGMAAWLSYASTFPGGLSAATFVKNTGMELPMLTGNIVAISVGGAACIIVTFITRWRLTPEMEEEEWDKTRDIDNPLSPWVTKYKGELNLDDGEHFHDRPPLEIVIRKFRTAKYTAYTAAVLFTVFFMGLWPGSMLTVDILDLSGFNIWTTISRGWAFTAAAIIIILPLFQEVSAILKQLKKNKKEGRMDDKSQNEALMQPLQQKNSNGMDSRPIIKSNIGYKIINKHLDLSENNCSLSNSSSSSSISSTADSKSSSTSSLVNTQ